ncbi:MAG: GtrA family protein [Clostridia bacterium]
MQKIKVFIADLKIKHYSVYQFIQYTLLSGITTIVDFGAFIILNYWIFDSLKTVDFHWWILDYSVSGEVGGGLAGFLATTISYAIAQVFNFFIQRKKTFHATNNALYSGSMYAVMIISGWFLQIWLAGIFMRVFGSLLGQNWGDILAKMVNNTIAFAIQFPMNKWVIMRHTDK